MRESPTTRCIFWGGRRLREFRKDAGLTADAVARKSGFSETKISRVERSIGSITVEDLLTLLGIYGANRTEMQTLTDLARSTTEYGRHGTPRTTPAEVYLSETTAVSCWGPQLIPPPLRTAAYARATAKAATGWRPPQITTSATASGRWLDRLTDRMAQSGGAA